VLPSAGLAEETLTGLVVHPFWVVVSILNFLVLLYLLRRYLWGPLLSTMHARAEKIREGLAAAEAAHAERERMQEEVARLLAEARREAGALADRIANAAEAAAADIRAQASAEAERIRQRARADAQQLHDQALAQLRSEVAGMVVLAAARVLGREVSADEHRGLIERSLDEAGAQLSGGAR